jgi:hypothetical protein
MSVEMIYEGRIDSVNASAIAGDGMRQLEWLLQNAQYQWVDE